MLKSPLVPPNRVARGNWDNLSRPPYFISWHLTGHVPSSVVVISITLACQSLSYYNVIYVMEIEMPGCTQFIHNFISQVNKDKGTLRFITWPLVVFID